MNPSNSEDDELTSNSLEALTKSNDSLTLIFWSLSCGPILESVFVSAPVKYTNEDI